MLVNPVNKKKGLMGEMLDGGMAEYCAVAADQLVAMPAGVSFEDAASLPVAYGTAHRMLITHNTVKRGDNVLVLGASGGVGTGCVLLAKMLGAEVIACASSAEKLERLKAMGADEVVDYTKTDWSKWAVEKYGKPQRRTYDGGVDVVVNFTGGDTWVPSLRCLKRGGKLLVCGATAGYDPKEDLRYVWSFEIANHRLQQFLRRQSRGADGADRRRQDQAGDRQGAAARTGARRPAPDPGPRGHRQSGGDAVSEHDVIEQVQALVTRAPFHQWLGLTVLAVGDDSIEIKATWREEWVVNNERGYTHGGILAALIDLAADWAMVKQTGRGVPTIDLRVDYHRAAMPGDLIARGKVIRGGSQFATAEAQIFDKDGKLIASGRGTYLTAPPKPA